MRATKRRCLLLLLLLQICFLPVQMASAEQPYHAPERISVVIDDNYPPYSFRDERGQLQGISIEQWEKWEEQTGIAVDIDGMSWSQCLQQMQDGKYDVIDTMFFSRDRTKIFDYLAPYAEIDVLVFFDKNISGIHDINALKGFPVGVKRGDSCIEYLQQNGVTNLKQYGSYESMLKAAKEQKLVVFIMDKPPAFHYIYKMQMENQFNYADILSSGELHRCVLKGNMEMLRILENGFSAIPRKEYEEINNKWLGNPYFKPLFIRHVESVGTIVALAIFVLVLWIYMLRRAVKKKTATMEAVLEALKTSETKYRELSIQDALTGLHNRDYFERLIHDLSTQEMTSCGLVICDLDGLKLINDTMGHSVGDEYLIAGAGLIAASFQTEHGIARIGGDEFAVVMPEVSELDITNDLIAFKKSIDEYNQTNDSLRLSISCGYSFHQGLEIDLNEMYKEADNHMYREKLHRRRSVKSEIVETMKVLLKERDFITKGHVDRVQKRCCELAAYIGIRESELSDIRLLAQFHDIGKVGIADRILNKPAKLTEDEMKEMKRHSEIGARIAEASFDLMPIADGILKHHEGWDGNGYPMGLKGEDIPIQCRILAIVDAYDAMVNDRPYRKAMREEEAIAELKRCSGTQFDPFLVEKFLDILKLNS